MNLWGSNSTSAFSSVGDGMKVVDGLMSFTEDAKGNRNQKEQPLYAASVTFLYAVWENYAEDVAIEAVERLANGGLEPSQIPASVREVIEEGATAWDLSVHPGWQELWIRKTRERAKGSEADKPPWGVNSASVEQVRNLLSLVGIDPIPTRIPTPEDTGSHSSPNVPERVNADNEEVDVSHVLRRLIQLRGELVHTGSSQETIYKHQVFWWKSFVEMLVSETDGRVIEQVAELVEHD